MPQRYIPAFVTHDIVEYKDIPVSTVVRARRVGQTNGILIEISPIHPPDGLADLFISIDSHDLAEVQRILGENRWVPADDEGVVPDEHMHLATAIKSTLVNALLRISTISDPDWNQGETWKDKAEQCIDISRDALSYLAEEDADYADL